MCPYMLTPCDNLHPQVTIPPPVQNSTPWSVKTPWLKKNKRDSSVYFRYTTFVKALTTLEFFTVSASKTCSAINCSNSKWSRPDLTFFKFPKQEARCKVWVQNVRREDLLSKSMDYCQRNLRLCSKHFQDTEFLNATVKKRLTWNAVPRLFDIKNAPKKRNPRRKLIFAQHKVKDAKIQETPTKVRLKKATFKVSGLSNLLRKKDREIKRLKKQLKKSEEMEEVIESMRPYLSKDEHELVAMQMRMKVKKRKVYSDHFRAFAIGVYFKSPCCYRFLQGRFHLPSKSTINRWISQIFIHEGFCPNLLKLLKVRVERLKKEDRICVLMLDEISLKERIDYNATIDKVVGLAPSHGSKMEFTTNSLVLLVSGLRGHFRQAFAHFFWKNAVPGEKVHAIVLEALDKLEEIGLTVKVITADQGSNFIALLNLLGVSKRKAFFERGGKKVFCMADVPHLLKSTRNCLSRNKIETSTGEAHWNVIVDFYNKDKDMKDARMAPKLKKIHFDLEARGMKMKVKWACQTLSRTVSAGIRTYAHFGQLGPHAVSTATFITNINNLFDVCNSSRQRGITKFKSAMTGEENDPNLLFLREMSAWLSTWKVINQKGENITSKFKFRDGWQMNISALTELAMELRKDYSFNYLLTRKLCTDPLENLFSIIRSARGLERNPGAYGFTQTLKTVVSNWMLKSEISSNNEWDESTNLMIMSRENLLTFQADTTGTGFCLSPMEVHEALESSFDILEGQGLQYLSGYLYKTLLNLHPSKTCQTCQKYAGQITSTTTTVNEHEVFVLLKRYEDEKCTLASPTIEFTSYVGKATRVLGYCFRHYLGNHQIVKSLKQVVMDLDSPAFCSSEKKEKMVAQLVKTLFFNKIKRINDDIKESGKNSAQSRQKMKILMHQ